MIVRYVRNVYVPREAEEVRKLFAKSGSEEGQGARARGGKQEDEKE